MYNQTFSHSALLEHFLLMIPKIKKKILECDGKFSNVKSGFLCAILSPLNIRAKNRIYLLVNSVFFLCWAVKSWWRGEWGRFYIGNFERCILFLQRTVRRVVRYLRTPGHTNSRKPLKFLDVVISYDRV